MCGYEPLAPCPQSGNLAYPSYQFQRDAVPIADREDIECEQAEDADKGKRDPYRPVHWYIAAQCEYGVDENRDEPEPEMSEEVHHGIQDDRRRSALLAYVLGEFHNTVWLAAKSSHGRSIVQGVAGDCKPVESGETDTTFSRSMIATLDNAHPRQGVDGIYHEPYTHDRHEPITSLAYMHPQVGKTDVEGEHHDYHGSQAEEEEQVVYPLLGPGHGIVCNLSVRMPQKRSCLYMM